MPEHLLIVGSGPGLALSTARRFGREGHAVTLLGRTPETLEKLRAALAEDGVDATVRTADVTAHAELTGLITEIDTQNPVDVCVFQPGGGGTELRDVRAATVANTRPNLELLVLGAIAVGEALLAPMLGRGAGSLIFSGGGSARTPLPFFGNLGPAMAGLRNYALTLHKSVAGTGVHAAFFTVAGMIATGPPGAGEIDPQALADRLWRLAADRDTAEVVMSPSGEVIPRSAR
jgi:short-subunit dehydrogenase